MEYQDSTTLQGHSLSGGTRGQISWSLWAEESPSGRQRSLLKFSPKHQLKPDSYFCRY